MAIARLWPLCSPEGKEGIKELTDAVTKAFSYTRTISSPLTKGETIEASLRDHLRTLSDTVFADLAYELPRPAIPQEPTTPRQIPA
ncbi:hypothetical protein ACFOY2_38355 [Nonomuraea purpurea]|uniref:Uncharacterized protein n=1 Tax=Nonomuraea purpurea TaxID=1849276 RepID=A0ABV8GGR0_9ACTN